MNEWRGKLKMRILVTGANGFLGPYVVRKLIAGGHEVLAMDNLRYGPPRFSKTELLRFLLDTTDLRDHHKVDILVRKFDPQAVIHLAAIHFIPECEKYPDLAVTTNILATVNLLTACSPRCRFVFASTAAVYAPHSKPHDEATHKIGPMDVYGFTKLSGEHFVSYFSGLRGFQSVIVRLFNLIGPGETNPHLLPDILKQLKAGKRELKLGNIHPKRDYIYVEDAAAGFVAAATKRLPAREKVVIANLGTGKSYSVKEIVDRMSAILGEKIVIHSDPSKKRKVDRPNLCADNRRFKSVFSWKPRVDIDEALRRTWENPDMIRTLFS